MLSSSNSGVRSQPESGADIYVKSAEGALGRALSRLDFEPTSSSYGSFDRTWWAWKFTDFSASRFQEGIYTLAWLVTSPVSPLGGRSHQKIVDASAAALRFWIGLQHKDGSFDEAYPFERSLAATAFTGFYVGCGLERLRSHLPPELTDSGLRAIERGARWLDRNGEYHGILSNHLAAAAAALQVAGDLLGTDRFAAARERYLGVIAANQDKAEGWLKEYGGADPGYQSHGMFYLTEIWRRTRCASVFDCLRRATGFMAWFAHPDGTFGGEYASRGTKFAYPAAFELLAPVLTDAAAIAAHLRGSIAGGRGIGPDEVDAWNLFPLLNNYLCAAEAAQPLPPKTELPWQRLNACQYYEHAGLAVARRGERVMAIGLSLGGAVKLWEANTGMLVYQDSGYAILGAHQSASSQSQSTWSVTCEGPTELAFRVSSPFTSISRLRFRPWRFICFRAFTLTAGRFPFVARGLKQLLVTLLIRRKSPSPGRLQRCVTLSGDGRLTISDVVTDVEENMIALDRHVPFHMGSARYCDLVDAFGAEQMPPAPRRCAKGNWERRVEI